MIIQHSMILNDPNANLQDAVDATPAGGILRLGIGTFTVPSGGLVLSRGITIQGSGMNTTIIEPFSVAVNQPVIVVESDASITPDINGIVLNDFSIDGNGAVANSAPAVFSGAYGIVMDPAATQLIRHVAMNRLYIHHCSDSGLHVTGNGGDTCVIGLRIRDCIINENWGDGAYIQGAVMVILESNLYASNYGRGCTLTSVPLANGWGDYFENNCHDHGFQTGYDAQLFCYGSNINLTGLTFEDFNNTESNESSEYLRQRHAGGGSMTAMGIQLCTGRVSGCRFFNDATLNDLDERAIFIDNAAFSPALEIGPCQFDGVYVAISNNVSAGATRNTTIATQNRHTNTAAILGSTGYSIPNVETIQISDLGWAPQGQLLFDIENQVAKMWAQGSWREIVAGLVYYADEPVSYQDEPVTY